MASKKTKIPPQSPRGRSRLFKLEHEEVVSNYEPVELKGFRGWLTKRLIPHGSQVAKAQRTMAPRYIFDMVPSVIEPAHDMVTLFDDFMKGWCTRQILRAIKQEVLGRSWSNQPKFVVKCTHCGTEYQQEKEECDICSEKPKLGEDGKPVLVNGKEVAMQAGVDYELREPDQLQKQIADRLTTLHPNASYNFRELLSSSITYFLALDDFYWSIAYGYEIVKNPISDEPERIRVPFELWCEDTRFIRPIADSYGHLGNDQYFCSQCYDGRSDQPVVKVRYEDVLAGHIPTCPQCDGPLTQTIYVQAIQGKITARLGPDEIVHSSMESVKPELFGNPRMVSVIKLSRIIEAMDEYNLGVYSEGKVGSLITFPGMDQGNVDNMLAEADRALQERENQELKSGKLQAKKKIRTVVLGVPQAPVRLPVLEDLAAMQSKDFYDECVEKICALYGVTPVFVSIIESGKSGANPRMQIDVQNRTTREIQSTFEDLMNQKVYPVFKITDWLFQFEEIEQRDEMREAQIEQTKSVTALNWRQAGFNVTLDEDGKLVVSTPQGQGVAPPQGESQQITPSGSTTLPPISQEAESADEEQRKPVPPGAQGTQPLPRESEASGDLIDRSAKSMIVTPAPEPVLTQLARTKVLTLDDVSLKRKK